MHRDMPNRRGSYVLPRSLKVMGSLGLKTFHLPTLQTVVHGAMLMRGFMRDPTAASLMTTDCRFKPRCYTMKVLLATNQVFAHFPIAVGLSTKIGGKEAIGGTPGRITKITWPSRKTVKRSPNAFEL